MPPVESTPSSRKPSRSTSLTPALESMYTETPANKTVKDSTKILNSVTQGVLSQAFAGLNQFRKLADECLLNDSPTSASFFADKAFTLSGEAEDVMRLARSFYAEESYRRAAHVLESSNMLNLKNIDACLLASRALTKAGKRDDCLKLLERITGDDDEHTDLIIEYSKRATQLDYKIHPLASLCCLRGRIYAELDSRVRAAIWLKAALNIDHKCVDAFCILVSWHLLSGSELEILMASLPFEQEEEPLKELYTSKLGMGSIGFKTRQGVISKLEKFGLGHSSDVMAAKADFLYQQYNDRSALLVCESVLARDPHADCIKPTYIVCLLELKEKAQLFFTANTLAEQNQNSALALFGLGCYNMLVEKYEDAWRLFHRAAQQEPNCIFYWMAMGNAAAAQDDSDRAVGAYRAAARACSGSFHPPLYIAIEYLRTNNLGLANHFLNAAGAVFPPSIPGMNDRDPLWLNEMGILAFRRAEYNLALAYFLKSADGQVGYSSEPALSNLGHAFRKLGKFEEAVKAYEKALSYKSNSPGTLNALGFTFHLQQRYDEAIRCYHQALSLRPRDPLTSDLHMLALQDSVEISVEDISSMNIDNV